MGLLDDLRKIHLPPSHIPSVNEIASLLGAVAAYTEHGEDLLKAAEEDAKAQDAGEPAVAVDQLLSPPPEEPAPAPAAVPAPAALPAEPLEPAPAGVAPDDRDARIAELEQQLANERAQQSRTQASVDAPPPPPPAV